MYFIKNRGVPMQTGRNWESFSYTFNVAEPVPEPAIIESVGAEITGLLAWQRRRRHKKQRKLLGFEAQQLPK